MTSAAPVLLGAVAGAVVSTIGPIVTKLFNRSLDVRDRHAIRALAVHLQSYERIFVAARTLQSTIEDFESINQAASDRFDPFLPYMLNIVKGAAGAYAVEVDWRHNSGMYYLPLSLESRCLEVRTDVNRWIAAPRLTYGYRVHTRLATESTQIEIANVQQLRLGSYSELTIARVRMVAEDDPKNSALLRKVRRDLKSLIRDIKKIIAQ